MMMHQFRTVCWICLKHYYLSLVTNTWRLLRFHEVAGSKCAILPEAALSRYLSGTIFRATSRVGSSMVYVSCFQTRT